PRGRKLRAVRRSAKTLRTPRRRLEQRGRTEVGRRLCRDVKHTGGRVRRVGRRHVPSFFSWAMGPGGSWRSPKLLGLELLSVLEGETENPGAGADLHATAEAIDA